MKLAAKLPPLVAVLAVAACSESTAVRLTNTESGRLNITTAAEPASVRIVSSFQSEFGCAGDWQPDCTTTNLTYDAEDGIWEGPFMILPGSYEYKVVLNGTWDENYGRYATFNGPNIPLISSGSPIKFYYDNDTHWITDNANSVIATATGSFQSELGCNMDWDPACLRSWLQDPDGDGIYSFTTTAIPAGNYEVKAALNESWSVNYGSDGEQNGPNIPFNVPENGTPMVFTYSATTHVLSISVQPESVDDQIADLEAAIADMGLQRGTTQSLTAKLNALKSALAADNSATTCQALTDLTDFARAQRGKKIPAASADAIISQAAEIADKVGC